MVPTARRGTARSEKRPGQLSRPAFLWAAPRAVRSRFNPAHLGRIAGSVAARRTYQGELAASEPDGTRVLMLPAVLDNSGWVST